MSPSIDRLSALKVALFLVCLLPLGHYAIGWQQDTLGANPIETIIRGLGTWGLNFLLITLAITPLRRLSGLAWLMPLRRMLGLFSFFYVVVHWIVYLWLDQSLYWNEILADILKRPFIAAGMMAFCLLIPLAATSNQRAIRRLGGKRWQALHRLVYPIGALALLHYAWMVKADITAPLAYATLFVGLLAPRLFWRFQTAQRSPRPRPGAEQMHKAGKRVIPLVVKR